MVPVVGGSSPLCHPRCASRGILGRSSRSTQSATQTDRLHRRVAGVPLGPQRFARARLLRTYAVPSIAPLLASTGEFTGRGAEAIRRHADPDLGVLRVRARSDLGRALSGLNRIHGRFEIATTTISTSSRRWCRADSLERRFGWRPLVDAERLPTFRFWRAVGGTWASGTSRGLRGARALNVEFERGASRHRRRPPRRRGARDMFLDWSPACRSVSAAAGARAARPRCSRRWAWRRRPAARAVARHRSAVGRALRVMPPRRPCLRTLERHRAYPTLPARATRPEPSLR